MKKILMSFASLLLIANAGAQIDCDIVNIQGAFAAGYLEWNLGESGVYTFIDPAGDYPIGQGCQATYPYLIENVEFDLASGTAFGLGSGIGTFEYQINIYAVDGNACNNPGVYLGGSGIISVELNGAFLTPQNVSVNVAVYDAFFISYEPISWTGSEVEVPTILWDGLPLPECVQFFTEDGGDTFEDFTEALGGEGTGWVDFNIFGSSETGSGCTVGNLSNAAPEELCPGETTVLSTNGSAVVPPGGDIGIIITPGFDGEGGLGEEFIVPSVTLPYNVEDGLNGYLAANSLPTLSGTWEFGIAVYSNQSDPEGSICSLSNTKTIIFLDSLASVCEEIVEPDGPCLIWVEPTPSSGWTDFNTDFGGAPCDDGSGCPLHEIAVFEIWQSEAYGISNFQAGGIYTFSHCNGPGAGSWIPEYTIIAPSGAIDAYGEGNGDGCSITWTASESGTYLVVINEAGACGEEGNIDNGFPAITCEGTPECEPIYDDCIDDIPYDIEDVCVQATIAADPFCCETEWDEWCDEAYQLCVGVDCDAIIPYENNDECVQYVTALDPSCCETEWNAQCEDAYQACLSIGCLTWVSPTPTSGWTDFNTNFGGAPCDDGSGCPLHEITDYEVWQSEAYEISNILEGGIYTFSHCNGPGAGSWIPEYTIFTPSGSIDANGTGNGDGCSITWTASQSGTYKIVINEAGACGVEGSIDNGFPAITCEGTPECEPDEVDCVAEIPYDVEDDCVQATIAINPACCEIAWDSACEESYQLCLESDCEAAIPYDEDDACVQYVISFDPFCCDGVWDDLCEAAYQTCSIVDCLSWENPSPTSGWIDFNTNFGGAPCDDGSGCPLHEITDYEVWQSEAYEISNILEGGIYTFSHCNGPGAGSWIPEYTIFTPSGVIDAHGAGNGDGCSITWTASESGTYMVVINEAGACGLAGSVDNGYPAISCESITCDGDVIPDDIFGCNISFEAIADTTGANTIWIYPTANIYNALEVLWDFGDGNSSTDLFPTHSYAGDGPYLLCLTVVLDDPDGPGTCTESHCMELDEEFLNPPGMGSSGFSIVVLEPEVVTFVDEYESQELRIWPNPTRDLVTVQLVLGQDAHLNLELYDVSGRKCLARSYSASQGENLLQLDLGGLPAGVYLLRLVGEHFYKSSRLVKQ